MPSAPAAQRERSLSGLVLVPMMMMRHVSVAIGAALRIEARLDCRHFRPETFEHVGDHAVLANENPILMQFGRQVPIADLPSQSDEMASVAPAHFEKRFGPRLHFHMASIGQKDGVAITNQNRLGQIEKKGDAPVRDHRHAAAVASLLVKGDPIIGLRIVTTPNNGRSDDHDAYLLDNPPMRPIEPPCARWST